eukprot:TRINITY_DN29748_c0_g1_i1.p1 TRINITY_DN29748_c0_g1~~TRINITY_DN29748_c0_g1_i1.p1  ORF type:complete len:686 (-),score=77.95 TRINITY_DN29748_c0_g1_i1:16-2073(-)
MAVNWDDPYSRWNDLPAFAAQYNPYPHQVEAFCKAAWENTIVILPTGTGKTMIAAMLIDLYSIPDTFTLFVVNNVALVEQQTRYLKSVCKSPWSKIHSSHSGLNVGVTVGTAGALLGFMPALPMDKLGLVVFDEVHHATGDHPYVQILSLIREHCPVYPRILGLTASWLDGELRDIEMRRYSLQSVVGANIFVPEVSEHLTSKAKFQKVNYPDERPELAFAHQMAATITSVTDALHPELAAAFAGQAQKAIHVETSLGTAGLSVFPHALCEIVGAQLHAKAAHAADELARETTNEALRSLPHAKKLLDADEPGTPFIYGEPSAKAKVLLDLMNGRKGLTLVFVEQVCCVLPVAAMLANHLQEPVLHVTGTFTMRKETRDMHIGAFRDGKCRVLVATSALEEGLDVPDCDCVIRFDAFSNVKSHVQGSGRARKAGSEVFYFDNSPDEEEKRTALMYGVAAGQPSAVQQQSDASPTQQANSQSGGGEGHNWGPEDTIWDHAQNKSFRGQRCLGCGAHLRITSRKYGQGRKKTERIFTVEGPLVCPAQESSGVQGSPNGSCEAKSLDVGGYGQIAAFQSNALEEKSYQSVGGYGGSVAAPQPVVAQPSVQTSAQVSIQPGTGEGHAWGAEDTIWDHTENKSFRGQRCTACGACLRITSRKYGQGGKKTERMYSVQGAFVCSAQAIACA